MSISFEKFESWAKNKFGKDDIVVKGKEIRLNSIFTEDAGNHMWCSPSGGKKKRKWGVYHCFKTGEKGNLIKLVSLVENCDWHEAKEILNVGNTSIRDLESQVDEFFRQQELEEEEKSKVKVISFPPNCSFIEKLKLNNWWRLKCEEYLNSRKIPINELLICTAGEYKSRIIIPYYNANNDLIYWNARHLFNGKPKYRGPDKEIGVGKSDVVYFPYGQIPKKGECLYVCEGEFNAISLFLSGLHSAAFGGKEMSDKQALYLKDYSIIICLDNDQAGIQGTSKISACINQFVMSGNKSLSYVRPPSIYNDWNEMYIQEGKEIVKGYIEKYKKNIDTASLGHLPSWELLIT